MEKLKSMGPVKYKIIGIEQITHDTKSFKFGLPDDTALDFLPGDHMMMHAEIHDQVHKRPYTPASTPDDVGFFELVIKVYPNGLLSNYMFDKYVGEEVFLEGPTVGGHFQQGMADKIAMVAGGAGITPMIAIIRTAIRRKWAVDMTLLYANKTVNDIILRDEFENYAAAHDNFHLTLAVDEPAAGFAGHVGFIDDDLLKKSLPPVEDDPLIFLCGPPMMEYKLREKILALGYPKKRLVIP